MCIEKSLGEFLEEKEQQYIAENEKIILDAILFDVQKNYGCDRQDAVEILLKYKDNLKALANTKYAKTLF